MDKNKILFWGSVILNVIFILGLLTVMFTPMWDWVMFRKALPFMCEVIREQNASEYNGFIKRICEEK